MHVVKRSFPLFVVAITLSGCGPLAGFLGTQERPSSADQVDISVQLPDAETARPQGRPGGAATVIGGVGLRPDQLDQTSDAERVAALAPPTARTPLLGETLAALGSPADPGLWLRTGLVDSVTPGRIEPVQGAGSLRVELRPSGAVPGSGSQLSLAAFSTLNLPLTQLVRLRVYRE